MVWMSAQSVCRQRLLADHGSLPFTISPKGLCAKSQDSCVYFMCQGGRKVTRVWSTAERYVPGTLWNVAAKCADMHIGVSISSLGWMCIC